MRILIRLALRNMMGQTKFKDRLALLERAYSDPDVLAFIDYRIKPSIRAGGFRGVLEWLLANADWLMKLLEIILPLIPLDGPRVATHGLEIPMSQAMMDAVHELEHDPEAMKIIQNIQNSESLGTGYQERDYGESPTGPNPDYVAKPLPPLTEKQKDKMEDGIREKVKERNSQSSMGENETIQKLAERDKEDLAKMEEETRPDDGPQKVEAKKPKK
jgi:hypothetical protein